MRFAPRFPSMCVVLCDACGSGSGRGWPARMAGYCTCAHSRALSHTLCTALPHVLDIQDRSSRPSPCRTRTRNFRAFVFRFEAHDHEARRSGLTTRLVSYVRERKVRRTRHSVPAELAKLHSSVYTLYTAQMLSLEPSRFDTFVSLPTESLVTLGARTCHLSILVF